MKLPEDRSTRLLLILVIVMGATILIGTAILIVALFDILVELGASASFPPAGAGVGDA